MWSMFVIPVLPHQNNERHIYLDALYKLAKPSFDGAYDMYVVNFHARIIQTAIWVTVSLVIFCFRLRF